MGRLLSIVAVVLLASAEAQRCPNDWIQFDNSCYVFIDEVVPWTSAVTFCTMLHANLVEIGSKAENDFVAAKIRTTTGINGAWTGLNDLVREGRWVYASNLQDATYFAWNHGEPNNVLIGTENGQDCVFVHEDGTWDDLWCETFGASWKPSPVCERPATIGEDIG